MKRPLVWIIGGLAVVAASWAAYMGLQAPSVTSSGGETGGGAGASAGQVAPDFVLPAYVGGSSVSLSQYKGQVVLVNFWATWCGPCRLEMPALQARYDGLKDQGFTVLAVNLDEPLEDAALFADELALTFPVLLDPGAQVFDLYRVRGYPTTYLINRDGLIDRQHVGIMSEAQLDDYLAGLGLLH